MDIRMPRLDGIEATRRLTGSDGDAIRVLILTTFGLDDYVYDALRAGASGFMLKDAPPEELLAAIEVVARGGHSVFDEPPRCRCASEWPAVRSCTAQRSDRSAVRWKSRSWIR